VFVNPDLTLYLQRPPRGEWVCLDAKTTVDPAGMGLARSTLFDEEGPIGTAVQALFVATR
jgi:acyl-CoA thioesterase